MTAHARIWPEAFDSHKAAALALLMSGADLSIKQGQFLGGLCFTDGGMSDKQREWLVGLLKRHGLPPLADGGGRG